MAADGTLTSLNDTVILPFATPTVITLDIPANMDKSPSVISFWLSPDASGNVWALSQSDVLDNGKLRVNSANGTTRAFLLDSPGSTGRIKVQADTNLGGTVSVYARGAATGGAITSPLDGNGFVQVSLATGLNNTDDQLSIGTGTTNGATPYHLLSAGSNNATVIKASAGKTYSYHLANYNTTYPVYVKFYDKATTPTPASDTVKFAFTLPAAASSILPTVVTLSGTDVGIQFTAGIAFAIVKGVGDTDNTSVLANDASINLTYS